MYSECKECQSKRTSRWQAENPEKVRAQYLRRDKDYYKKLSPEAKKRIQLRNDHGITLEQYFSTLAAQDYTCAICGVKEPGGRGAFHVDHDHSTGRNRGMLCARCNLALGYFKDNPELMRKAAEYVEVWGRKNEERDRRADVAATSGQEVRV